MPKYKKLTDIDFKLKRVLLRADFNVPIETGVVKDDSRIHGSIPTIDHIIKQDKSKIVLISHLGRPKGKNDPALSLKPVAKKLEEIMKRKIIFIPDIISREGDEAVQKLGDGQIALAENIRFYPEEEAGSDDFAINLCHHFGVFVNEAFSASHRAHSSIALIPKYKPSCVGFIFDREVTELEKALKPSPGPSIAVIGGAKIETKLPVIENLAKIYDVVLVGGKVAVSAKSQKLTFPKNVILPDDFLDDFDIGPVTAEKYAQAISAAGFIVWNGAMGKFEENKYAAGTDRILKAICENNEAVKIAGGGETLELINEKRVADKFTYLSGGGGAMLEFLEGKEFPGIKALADNA